MTPVHDCHKVTKRLLDVLEAVGQDRDSQIAHAEQLLARRGQLLPHIVPPFTAEEQQLGREINAMNQQINSRMQTLSAAVKQDLREVKVKKRSMNKYTDPYEALQTDGVFYDKRN